MRTDLQPSRGGSGCGSMFPELEKPEAEFRQKDGVSSAGVPSVRDAGTLGGALFGAIGDPLSSSGAWRRCTIGGGCFLYDCVWRLEWESCEPLIMSSTSAGSYPSCGEAQMSHSHSTHCIHYTIERCKRTPRANKNQAWIKILDRQSSSNLSACTCIQKNHIQYLCSSPHVRIHQGSTSSPIVTCMDTMYHQLFKPPCG